VENFWIWEFWSSMPTAPYFAKIVYILNCLCQSRSKPS